MTPNSERRPDRGAAFAADAFSAQRLDVLMQSRRFPPSPPRPTLARGLAELVHEGDPVPMRLALARWLTEARWHLRTAGDASGADEVLAELDALTELVGELVADLDACQSVATWEVGL